MSYLKNDQEESDTKIVLHALDATANGATEISIRSPDTDVHRGAVQIFVKRLGLGVKPTVQSSYSRQSVLFTLYKQQHYFLSMP